MIRTFIKIHPKSENKKEVLQTLNSLSELTLKHEGCLKTEVFEEEENDKEILYLALEWATEEAQRKYKKSKCMAILIGIQFLLVDSLQIIQSVI